MNFNKMDPAEVQFFTTLVEKYSTSYRSMLSKKGRGKKIAISNRVAHLLIQMFPGIGVVPNKPAQALSGHRHCLPLCAAISQRTACEIASRSREALLAKKPLLVTVINCNKIRFPIPSLSDARLVQDLPHNFHFSFCGKVFVKRLLIVLSFIHQSGEFYTAISFCGCNMKSTSFSIKLHIFFLVYWCY